MILLNQIAGMMSNKAKTRTIRNDEVETRTILVKVRARTIMVKVRARMILKK